MSAQLIIKHNSDFADSLEKVKKKNQFVYIYSPAKNFLLPRAGSKTIFDPKLSFYLYNPNCSLYVECLNQG